MATLIQIGNSKGVRIPKAILEQTRLAEGEIEFVVTKEGLLLKPLEKKRPRKGWREAIERELKAKAGEKDPALDNPFLHEPLDEWEW